MTQTSLKMLYPDNEHYAMTIQDLCQRYTEPF